jgi:PEP-CTERM motif
MKLNRSLIGVLAAIGLSTVTAHATPTVILSGGIFAVEVDNLVVDGVFYDVTFGLVVDQTFQGNPSGALDAATALVAALNDSPAVNVLVPGVESANGFTVTDDSVGNGPTGGDPPATVQTWSVNIFGPSPPFAEFAAIPEPTTLALLASSLMALRATRRRRSRK